MLGHLTPVRLGAGVEGQMAQLDRRPPVEPPAVLSLPQRREDYGLGIWFEVDQDPGVVLDLMGRFKCANIRGAALIADGRLNLSPAGELRLGDCQSDQELERLIVCVKTKPETVLRLIVRLRDGELSAACIRRMGGVLVMSFHLRVTASPQTLQTLAHQFSLTRTESKILGEICDHQCPKQIARESEASEHTIRSHLRSIYAKLGTRSLTASAITAIQLMR
jgi:DNA-binding CsgD family transcriptional regulator